MAGFQKTLVKSLSKAGLFLAGVLVLMNPAPARAEIVLTLVTAGVLQLDGNFLYSYNVTLTDQSFLHAGGGGTNTFNNFTLYDVRGLIASTLTGSVFTSGAFTASTPLLGNTPSTEVPKPPDDPTIANIVGTFVGVPPGGTDIVASGMNIPLGAFQFESTNPLGSDMLAYTAATQKLTPLGAVANNTEQVAGPGGPQQGVVPEPATLLLLITGLPALGLYYRRRNK